jgi:translation initiation factor IF-3
VLKRRISPGGELIGKDTKDANINERVRAKEVRLIDDAGNQLGIVATFEALRIARERELDLVEVSPKAVPPVCKIMDYGKYKYQVAKKAAEARKKQATVQIKEMKMGLKIEEHDLMFKINHIRGFLEDGNKVKIVIMFRGREVLHVNMGQQLAQKIIESLKDVGDLEQKPKFDGRNIIMVFGPL